MIKLINNNCLDALKAFSDNSIDAIITDPPYQLDSIRDRFNKNNAEPKFGKDGAFQRVAKGFMGKEWDVLPSVEILKECLRVLKSGSFAFIICTPRQDSQMKMLRNLEEAGFNIGFTSLYWCYASGFPKAHNISKAIDKVEGVKRTVVKFDKKKHRKNATENNKKSVYELGFKSEGSGVITESNTDHGKTFEGWYGGFQPKPAVEVIIVVQKPMSERTFANQAIKSIEDNEVGKGCVNFDACRIPTNEDLDMKCKTIRKLSNVYDPINRVDYKTNDNGRFPANLVVEDSILDNGVVSSGGGRYMKAADKNYTSNVSIVPPRGEHYNTLDQEGEFSRYFNIDAWFREKLKKMPLEIQKSFPCFIVSKPSKAEKNLGCQDIKGKIHNTSSRTYDDICKNCGKKLVGDVGQRCECEVKVTAKRDTKGNYHPTVKPVKLMCYLIELLTLQGDTVLDPFMGSGSTGVASRVLGRDFIGIDMEQEYIDIAKRRIDNAFSLLNAKHTEKKQDGKQGELF